MLSALYDGVARSAQAWFIAFAKNRKPGSLGQSLATLPRFQEAIGENERLLAVNARLIRSFAADVDGGACPSVAESGFLKTTVTENAIQLVQRAVELAGNPACRGRTRWNDTCATSCAGRIHWPQTDAVRIAAGRAALGL